jgi:hypothetical protein
MAFAPEQLASIFAREASLILSTAGMAVTEVQLSMRLGEALRLRRIVAQAEGVIHDIHGVERDNNGVSSIECLTEEAR